MRHIQYKGQQISITHDIQNDFLHQILECNVGELRRKDPQNNNMTPWEMLTVVGDDDVAVQVCQPAQVW